MKITHTVIFLFAQLLNILKSYFKYKPDCTEIVIPLRIMNYDAMKNR